MRISRRTELRLDPELFSRLDRYATANAISRSGALRSLAARALDGLEGRGVDDPVGMAALMAAEHSLLLMAALLPEGSRRSAQLAEAAVAAAEARLAVVLREGEGRS